MHQHRNTVLCLHKSLSYSQRYDIMYNKIEFNEYKSKYCCTFNCKIAAVIIVLSLTVLFFVEIIAVLKSPFSFSQYSCFCRWNIINTLVCINTELFYFNSYIFALFVVDYSGKKIVEAATSTYLEIQFRNTKVVLIALFCVSRIRCYYCY